MLRKWSILTAVVLAVMLTATGFSAADEDSPIHKIMEKVSAKNNLIGKAVRTPVAYKKDQKAVVELAEELIKLGKEGRDDKTASTKQKKSQDEWTKFMDDYIAKTEALKEVAAKSGSTQVQAKTAHTAVKATCTNCHNVFKVDE